MKKPELIDQLVSELEPVKPLSPWRNTVIWSAFSVLFVAAGLMMMPLRQGSELLSQPLGVMFTIWFLINSIFMAFTANYIGIPGRKNQRLVLILGFGTYALLTGALVTFALTLQSPIVLNGTSCVIGVAGLGAVPLVFLFNHIRKLAPVSPGVMGSLLGLSACSIGAFGIGFSCTNEDPLHLLIFHFLAPAFLLAAFGAGLGKKFLKW